MKDLFREITHLVNHIETHLDEEISILKLCQNLNISPWHFQRSFRGVVGDTLGGYIRGRRLSHAAKMLLSTNNGIIDIALEVGFQTHESFTRAFKSYFKIAPKDFRKQKPEVLLRNKPLLTIDMLEYLKVGIESTPQLKLQEQTNIIGISIEVPSPFTIHENHCEYLVPAWYELLNKKSLITNVITNDYYGLYLSPSGNFTEQSFQYLAGIPVKDLNEIPDGMASYTFPKQNIAVFDLKKKSEDNMIKTTDYIYGYWLLNSKNQRARGIDYEYFENVDDFYDENLTSKYVVPIEK